MTTKMIINQLYFDGACRGNPGPGGAGAILMKKNLTQIVITNKISQFLSQHETNNSSEYQALILGLIQAQKENITILQVYGDSKLVIQQMKGLWKVRNLNLKKWFDQAQKLAKSFDVIKFKHIPRNINKLADKLANKAFEL